MIYLVKDWYGGSHLMTAKQLYERIKNDSKSEYNWLTSAAELTRVTGRPYFNDDYAIEIRAMILNCFASLEQRRTAGVGGKSTRKIDQQAAQECYNSLRGVTENQTACTARDNFLTAIIGLTTRAEDVFDFVAHPGASFRNFRNKWIHDKFLEYSAKDFINFEELYETLRSEWLQLKEAAEQRGDFAADDEAASTAIARKIAAALEDTGPITPSTFQPKG